MNKQNKTSTLSQKQNTNQTSKKQLTTTNPHILQPHQNEAGQSISVV